MSTSAEQSAKNGLVLGIMRETYDKWERRAPLCPENVRDLLQNFKHSRDGLLSDIIVQPSSQRIFTDEAYASAGAKVTPDLADADLILGVKRVADEDAGLMPDKSYMFFSHVIKGQSENMQLLRSVLDKRVRLLDYECIAKEVTQPGSDEKKKQRLVAFGKYAGIAGMIDSFQALGRRLLASGFSTPFLNCAPAYMYHDLKEAKEGVFRMGQHISNENELPPELEPLIFAFVGSGNVGKGAQEIFQLLPHKMITKDELEELRKLKGSQTCVYGLLVEQEDVVRRIGSEPGEVFDFAHYLENPAEYEPIFHETIAPHINVLVNGAYWDERYPRLITKEQMGDLYRSGNKRLFTVADISCDVNGSVQFLEKTTSVEHPYFTYNPLLGEVTDDITTEGVAVMGVDILPTELPRESSAHFGEALVPLLEKYIANHSVSNDSLQSYNDMSAQLPQELRDACITDQGSLTPNFEYIKAFMKRSHGAGKAVLTDPTLLLSIKGHVFDTGLINQILDVIESHDCHFEFQECNVRPTIDGNAEKSTVLLRLTSKSEEELKLVKEQVSSLVDLVKKAEASMKCYTGRMPGHGPAGKSSHVEVFEDREQRVLLLGAGRVSASLAEYLGRSAHRHITVASALETEARSVANAATRGQAVVLDVTNDISALSRLINESDVVVSLLPAPMHSTVAEECVNHKTDLVTASYESDHMRSLKTRCEEAGIAILNEVGLDPGMDHMSAMKLIDDIKERGGTITSFSSVCGGLPAPEAANNPLMYKFSWSPMGVLSASQNDAIYRMDGDTIEVKGSELLTAAKPFGAWPTLHLECLPNRNSLVYGGKYGIENASTIFRGTLRYHGFSDVVHVFKNMGLLNDEAAAGSSWSDAIKQLQGNFDDIDEFFLSCAGGDKEKANKAAYCLNWLGITANIPVSQPQSILKSFCDVLSDHLKYEDHERDMVLMHHNIQATFDDGRHETHHSSLQLFGEETGMTAMSKTVGYTAAVGTALILDGDVTSKGLLLPTSKEIYVPALAALEKEGIVFSEELLVDDAPKAAF